MKNFILFSLILPLLACSDRWQGLSAPELLMTGKETQKVQKADINNDGLIDIITLDPSDDPGHQSHLSLFLNLGKGQFHQVNYPVSALVIDFKIANLNSHELDEYLDIIVYGSNGVDFFLGQAGEGFGDFDLMGHPIFNQAIFNLDVADLDQNGRQDIVMSVNSEDGFNGIHIVFGTDGDWAAFGNQTYRLNNASRNHLQLADFNNDNLPDIILKGPRYYEILIQGEDPQGNLYTFFQMERFRFEAEPGLARFDHMALGHLNNDPFLDVVFTWYIDSEFNVCYALGDKDFTYGSLDGPNFSPVIPRDQCRVVGEGYTINNLTIEDINNDGENDVIIIAEGFNASYSEMYLFQNAVGEPEFRRDLFLPTMLLYENLPIQITEFIAFHINNDDYLDLILGNEYLPHLTTVFGRRGDNFQYFAEGQTINLPRNAESTASKIKPGHVFSENYFDLMAMSNDFNNFSLFSENENNLLGGEFSFENTLALLNPVDFEFFDSANDADDDIIAVNELNQIVIYRNNNGNLQPHPLGVLEPIEGQIYEVEIFKIRENQEDSYEVVFLSYDNSVDRTHLYHYRLNTRDLSFRFISQIERLNFWINDIHYRYSDGLLRGIYFVGRGSFDYITPVPALLENNRSTYLVELHESILASAFVDINDDDVPDFIYLDENGRVRFYLTNPQNPVSLNEILPERSFHLADSEVLYGRSYPDYDSRSQSRHAIKYFLIAKDFDQNGSVDIATYVKPNEFADPLLKVYLSEQSYTSPKELRYFYVPVTEVDDNFSESLGANESKPDFIGLYDNSKIRVLMNLGTY